MSMTKNKLLLGISLLTITALLFSACSVSNADTEPNLVGWIDDIQQSQSDENPGLLLIYSPDNKTSDMFVVMVSDKAIIGVRDGEGHQAASFDVLNVGQKVEVWFSGPVMESYPAQVAADKVIITDTSNSAPTVGIGISCDEFGIQKNITQEVEMAYRGLLVVTLCSNPSTGFQWSESAEISDPTVLKQYRHGFVPPEGNGVVGAAGSDVWEFRSLKKGTSRIHFEYSRPWEGGEKGEWTLELVVTVK